MSISFSSLLQAGDEYNLREFLGSEGQCKIQYLDWILGTMETNSERASKRSSKAGRV